MAGTNTNTSLSKFNIASHIPYFLYFFVSSISLFSLLSISLSCPLSYHCQKIQLWVIPLHLSIQWLWVNKEYSIHQVQHTTSTEYSKYSIYWVQYTPSTTQTQYSIYAVQHTPSTVYTEWSLPQVQHSPSTPYTKYTIHQVQHTPSTVYTKYSVHQVQHPPMIDWITASFPSLS